VRYAVNLPIFDRYADPRVVAELAVQAEQVGWDGFFVADHLLTDLGTVLPIGDPWITLAAVAVRTERLRIGPMVTPLARRRPWKVARETVSLDILSGGRLTLGVGLGYPPDADFDQFGEDSSSAVRADKLDEALRVVEGLWTQTGFEHSGEHYVVRPSTFLPRPAQVPRIPVWVGGVWPRPRPFRRAARWDGVVPMGEGLSYNEMMPPSLVREVAAFVSRHRESGDPFDLAHWGVTPHHGSEVMDDYADVGVTWWLETVEPWSYGWDGVGAWPVDPMSERIQRGPRG
jgi:alkanesulfonate monooxygenase SsuD/methylene tetrahydromethanopterin reductase-like flavin-dependent oxidoreductase (luciferase family)